MSRKSHELVATGTSSKIVKAVLKLPRLVENPSEKQRNKNMQLGNFHFPTPTEYWAFVF